MTLKRKYILLGIATPLLLGLGMTQVFASHDSSNICNSESGAAYGLCNAYCVAMACDSDEPRASIKACDRIFDNYDKIVGEAPPCVEVEFEVIKQCSPVAAPGERVDYVITYLSTSETLFGNVLLMDELPDGFILSEIEHEWNAAYTTNNPQANPPKINLNLPQLLVEVGSLSYMEGGTLIVAGYVDQSFESGKELINDVLGVAQLYGGDSQSSQDQCNTLISTD